MSKDFGAVRALSDVSLDLYPGEVNALVGHNGAGKSTLIKILAGVVLSDPPTQVTVDGRPIDAARGRLGHEKLRFVHQDLGLILELNAMDNLAIRGGFMRTRTGRIAWAREKARTRDLLARFDVGIDIERPLAAATPLERTVVAIAAALRDWDGDSGILVLDEPTAVLPRHEVSKLFEIIDSMRERGTSVLYVSHRLDEIFDIADRVTVLRGGRLVAEQAVNGLTKRSLVAMMLGKDVEPDYRIDVSNSAGQATAFEARRLHGRYVRDVNIRIQRGEIVGLAGLPGSGSEELGYIAAGHGTGDSGGEVRVCGDDEGQPWQPASRVRDARIAIVPADRSTEGLITQMTVGENLSLSILNLVSRRGLINRKIENDVLQRCTDDLDISRGRLADPISALSGGNQQKVLIGRSLARRPSVLVLNEPTAGVDVGARRAIYELIGRQAREGLSVLVSSSDVEDLLAICHRIVVMRDGAVSQILDGDGLSEARLVHAMEGTSGEDAE